MPRSHRKPSPTDTPPAAPRANTWETLRDSLQLAFDNTNKMTHDSILANPSRKRKATTSTTSITPSPLKKRKGATSTETIANDSNEKRVFASTSGASAFRRIPHTIPDTDPFPEPTTLSSSIVPRKRPPRVKKAPESQASDAGPSHDLPQIVAPSPPPSKKRKRQSETDPSRTIDLTSIAEPSTGRPQRKRIATEKARGELHPFLVSSPPAFKKVKSSPTKDASTDRPRPRPKRKAKAAVKQEDIIELVSTDEDVAVPRTTKTPSKSQRRQLVVLDTIDLTLDTTEDDEEEHHTKSGIPSSLKTSKLPTSPTKTNLDLAEHTPTPPAIGTQSDATPEKKVISPPRRPKRITLGIPSSPVVLPEDPAEITVPVPVHAHVPVLHSRPSSVDSTRTLSTTDDQPLPTSSLPEHLPASPTAFVPISKSSPVPADVAAYPSPTSEAHAEADTKVEVEAEAEAEDETVVPSIDIDDEDIYTSDVAATTTEPTPTITLPHPPPLYTARPMTINDVPSHLSAGVKFLQHQTIELVEISHADALALRLNAPDQKPLSLSPFQDTSDEGLDIWPATAPVAVGGMTSKFFDRMSEWSARTEKRKLERIARESEVVSVVRASNFVDNGSTEGIPRVGDETAAALPIVIDVAPAEVKRLDAVSNTAPVDDVLVLEASATLPVEVPESLDVVSVPGPAVDVVAKPAPDISVGTDVTSLDEVGSASSAPDDIVVVPSSARPVEASEPLDCVSVFAPAVDVSEPAPAVSIGTDAASFDEVSGAALTVDDVIVRPPTTLPVEAPEPLDIVSISAPAVDVAHEVDATPTMSVTTDINAFDEVFCATWADDNVCLESSSTLPVVVPAVDMLQEVVSEATLVDYVTPHAKELESCEATHRLAFVVNVELATAPLSPSHPETEDAAVVLEILDTPPNVALVVDLTEVNQPLPTENPTSMPETLDVVIPSSPSAVDSMTNDSTLELETATPTPFEAFSAEDSLGLDPDLALADAEASAARLTAVVGLMDEIPDSQALIPAPIEQTSKDENSVEASTSPLSMSITGLEFCTSPSPSTGSSLNSSDQAVLEYQLVQSFSDDVSFPTIQISSSNFDPLSFMDDLIYPSDDDIL